MKLLIVFGTTIASIVVLFILTKLLGNKQMSQLNMFDYIIGITIGSIAAEMATALDGDMLYPLTAMVLYAAAALVIDLCSAKSLKLRRLLIGRALILYQDGQLYRENLKKAKLDLNEFLTQCRIAGYFDLREIQMAVLENNGRIAFLPTSEARPATPEDLNRHPQKALPMLSVVLDGKVLRENLSALGYSGAWLEEQLEKLGFPHTQEVFLALCDETGSLQAYPKTKAKPDQDPFQ